MKNLFTLLMITVFLGVAIWKGTVILKRSPPPAQQAFHTDIPYIGRIQVLNGCGSGGSARIIADYLRKNNFDVKNIGNADNWNFPETLVISRISDTSIALQVMEVLHTKKMALIKNQENLYDVTVIVGPDYRERIQ